MGNHIYYYNIEQQNIKKKENSQVGNSPPQGTVLNRQIYLFKLWDPLKR